MHKKFQNNMILFLQRKVLYTKLKSKISMNLLKNKIGICTAFLEENNKHGVRMYITPPWPSNQIRFFDPIQNPTGRGSIEPKQNV